MSTAVQLVLFDDLDVPPATEVTAIVPNRPQGHIGLLYEGGSPVYFTDLGDGLHLWAGQSVRFSVEMARDLGEQLIAWAELRSEGPTP